MQEQNDHVFSLYKPFRNQLRNYNLIDSLYVVWCYSRNYTFDLPFPLDIELPNGFNIEDSKDVRKLTGLYEFEQEFLVREIILNCDIHSTQNTLKQKDKLAKLVNYLRRPFSEEIEGRYNPSGDFLIEFNRMAHRQFKWQSSNRQRVIFRYYKLYSEMNVAQIIKNRLQLDIYELFIIGYLFFRFTSEEFKLPLPYRFESTITITDRMVEIFFSHFSIPIEQAKEELKECQEMNENIFYSYNPLYAKPILLHENTFFCPIPLLLFWQITNGIYYSIVKENGFENAFGNSFQNYIGEVLCKSCDNSTFKILHEEKYGKEEKRTTDWLVVDDNCVLFIECKTKRMTLVSKSELDIKKGLENDLKKMASFITQLYKTYIDYSDNKYPQLTYQNNKLFVPLVVTLEEWYINLNPKIMGLLREFVISEFQSINLDASLIDKFPYYIRSSEAFETDIQLINFMGINEYFDKVKRNDLHDNIQSFQFRNIFEGEFEKTFIEPLG